MRRYVRNGHALDRSRYVHKIGDRWYVAKRCIAGAAGGTIYAIPTGQFVSVSNVPVVFAVSGKVGITKLAKSFAKRSYAVEYAAKVFGYEPLP